MIRVAIIGGGISGLAAAFALEERRRAGSRLEYTLYESSPRLGGVLRTEHFEGCAIEAGPDSFLTEKSWAADFCRTIGLGDQLIGSNDAFRKTYIMVRGHLVPMPDGLMFLVPTKILPASLSSLFSAATKLRMAREYFFPPRAGDHDESVASFVERHYGSEMVERLADPLLSGIYGGEADNLSVRAVLPRFVEMERTHGSLTRAMLAARKKVFVEPKKITLPIFTSLKNGMQQLTDGIVERLDPSSLQTSTTVIALRREAGGWLVSAGLQSDEFDSVILALPAPAAASVIRMASPDLAAELGAIQYTSSITVVLAYSNEVRQALPPGFGFLVPRSEGIGLLATTFVHNKFPHRAPAERALLRCFFGGAMAAKIWSLSADHILSMVRQELHQILGIRAEPLFTRIYKWNSAMPQYAVGHLERLERIENLRRQLPGLALAGNAYRGIGIPDCIRAGSEAAAEVAKEITT